MKIKDLVLIPLFAAIICVISLIPAIYLPITQVPITAQTLAVFITAIVGGLKIGTAATALYVALGAIGLPVFAGGAAGFGVILGPTGGYIIGFIFAAAIIGLFAESGSLIQTAIGIVLGIVVIYTLGTYRLSVVTGMDINAAFAAGSMPFIIPDFIKAGIAMVLGNLMKKRLQKAGYLINPSK